MTSENKTRSVEYEPIMTPKRWIPEIVAAAMLWSTCAFMGYSLAANCAP